MISMTAPKEEPPMTSHGRRIVVVVRLLLVLAIALAAWPPAALADLMVVGNDEKVADRARGRSAGVAGGAYVILVGGDVPGAGLRGRD